jgi:hypothetical protein
MALSRGTELTRAERNFHMTFSPLGSDFTYCSDARGDCSDRMSLPSFIALAILLTTRASLNTFLGIPNTIHHLPKTLLDTLSAAFAAFAHNFPMPSSPSKRALDRGSPNHQRHATLARGIVN